MSVKGVKLKSESYFSISPGVSELWRKNRRGGGRMPPGPDRVKEARGRLKATVDNRVTTRLSLYPHSFLFFSVSFGEHSAAYFTSRSYSIQLYNFHTIIYTMLLSRSLKIITRKLHFPVSLS